jgi:hypothetical protein
MLSDQNQQSMSTMQEGEFSDLNPTASPTGADISSRSTSEELTSASAFVTAADRPEGQAPAVQEFLSPFFRNLGYRVSSSPQLVLLICITAVALCTLGLLSLHIETEPLKLWVPPAARAAKDKSMYDKEFGPFYRIEQLILSTKAGPDGKQPPVLTKENIELVRLTLPSELFARPSHVSKFVVVFCRLAVQERFHLSFATLATASPPRHSQRSS